VAVIEKVRFALAKYRMVEEGDKVVVAVSGGPDSVALLDILFRLRDELGITLHVAHLNHMFRGQDAEKDAAFVQEIAEHYGLPVIIDSFNVPAHMKKTGLSAQVAARTARYRFLERVAKEVNAQRVALGHHADDQAETVLINFLRGAGPAGLKGIPPVRDGFYIRPLFSLRRRDIEEYCRERGLDARLDASNLKPVYLRNKIRLELIPLLEKDYNPQLVATLARLADVCREENEFIDQMAESAYREVNLSAAGKKKDIHLNGGADADFAQVIDAGMKGLTGTFDAPELEHPRLDLMRFEKLPLVLKRRVVRKAYGQIKRDGVELPFRHVQRVIDFARKGKVGSILDLPGAAYIVKTYNRLDFNLYPEKYPPDVPYYCYRLKVPGETYIPELDLTVVSRVYGADNKTFQWDRVSPGEAILDSDALPGSLYVRRRRPGDRFAPLGLGGTMKLKKFFIESKVPREMRDRIPLVTANGDIIWVGGMRPGEKWKVTPSTKRVLHLKLLSNNRQESPTAGRNIYKGNNH